MRKFSFIFLIIIIAIGVFFYVKNTNSPTENTPEESSLDRQEIMQDVAEKISDISPVKPILGGSWHVSRFWFVRDNNENFYVEYEDGHILRQVLLGAEKESDRIKYKVIGYFEPGETNWVLKKGEDPFFGSSLNLYEHDEESSRWVKKN